MSRIRARLSDPHAPSWGWLVSAGGAAAAIAGLSLESGALGWFGLATCLAAPLFRLRSKPRKVELVLGHGKIGTRFPFGPQIRGRKLIGASTSYLADGRALLTLRTKRRTRTLELADAARAKEVRDALGIGHYGFGWLRFETVRSGGIVFAKIAAALGALLAVLAYFNQESFGALAIFTFVIAAAATLLAGRGVRGFVDLAAGGIALYNRDRPRCYEPIRYDAIHEAHLDGDDLVLVLENRERIEVPLRRRFLGVSRGASTDEAAALLAQIDSAIARAHGLGPVEPEVLPSIAELGAGPGGVRGWLDRIDGMAARLAHSGGYRGAPIAEEDLWAALENHDADADARAAAARVLIRANAKHAQRIVDIAKGARDPRTEKRIRVALLPEAEAEKKFAKLMADAEHEAAEAERAAPVVNRATT